MSYKVLYRQYRPKTFNDIVDQKFITDTLKESIILNKISHAYIFSGPKGTGKTSTAKVFAKAINCENPIDGEPCGKCDSCINFDSNPDVIELDAASNNKVEDIREIINNVKLAPSNSKYKIYIIDEVHMLTNSASNAFLLTLEEPPSHAIFILATTNPESLPQTILSRCQHFAFSKISKKALNDRIKYVLENEKISMSDEIINEIANLSDGGLRDALSILDQLITLNKPITIDLLTEQFGVVSEKILNVLIDNIIFENYGEIRNIFIQLKDYGISERSFSNKMISLLTNKICELKIQNDDENVQKLKKITFDIISIDSYKTDFNYYDIIEMIIISNLTNTDNNNISQEIKNNTIDEIETEKKELQIENKVKNDIKENIVENKDNDNKQNLQLVNIDHIIDIRINNSFANASLSLKKKFEENFEKFVDKLKDHHEIYSLLLDTKVGVVSSTNVLLITETKASCKLLNNYANIISDKVNSDKKYVFVTKDEWTKLTENYKHNKNNKIKYKYIEEPSFSNNEDDLSLIAADIFGNENIIMEDE